MVSARSNSAIAIRHLRSGWYHTIIPAQETTALPLITNVTAEIREIPLTRAFVTSKDNLARMVSRAVLIKLDLDNGTSAVGEAVPVEYVTGETPETVMNSLEAARPGLIGLEAMRLQPAAA